MEPPASPRTRLVESIWIARAPLAFRELCERAVPEETRLLVLDLDRTLHLGRNMGELLGWEISAHGAYGPAYLASLEARRRAGRFYLDRRRPVGALRYLWSALRVWAPPGLFYLLWGKLAARVALLRRRSYLRFGPEPVQAVQRVPQTVLFRQMASLSADTVRELSARVWRRHVADQTIDREDLAWLRARCPGIRVVLSSASPREVVETAAAALGVDPHPRREGGARARRGVVYPRRGSRRRLRRRAAALAREFRSAELEGLLAPMRAAVERLAADLEAGADVAGAAAARVAGARPLAELAYAMAQALERSRALLDRRLVS